MSTPRTRTASTTSTDISLLVQKSVSNRLLSSQSYYMQQKPGLLLPLTSKLLKPSAWSVRDSCCRSVGNNLSEMTRSQQLTACLRSRKSSAAVVAPSSVTSRDYHKMSRRTWPFTATSTCLSADPESDGSTRSGRTVGFLRRTCGGMRLVVVTTTNDWVQWFMFLCGLANSIESHKQFAPIPIISRV